jgi:anti-anti-sigma factor
MIELTSEVKAGRQVIRCQGRLDVSSCSILEKKINDLVNDGESQRLVLEFSKVTHLSCAGMRLLHSATRKLRARGGDLLISGIQTEVMGIMKMAAVDRMLSVHASEQEALSVA